MTTVYNEKTRRRRSCRDALPLLLISPARQAPLAAAHRGQRAAQSHL
eukprot:COSAG02_NODE_4514_length_5276_cov_1.972571_3_plen_47_part_00